MVQYALEEHVSEGRVIAAPAWPCPFDSTTHAGIAIAAATALRSSCEPPMTASCEPLTTGLDACGGSSFVMTVTFVYFYVQVNEEAAVRQASNPHVGMR